MSGTDEERDSAMVDEEFRRLQRTTEYFQLLKELQPLIEGIASSRKVEELDKVLEEASSRSKKSGERMRVLKDDSKAGYESQADTLRKGFLYLALFETSVTNILDLLVIVLVLNGHDFYVQPFGEYPRYAKDLDDLDNSGVADKLYFLKIHGFSMITDNINNKLRNKIAHMDFDTEGKGIIHVGIEEYNLQDEIVKLESILLLSAQVLGSAGLLKL